MTLEMVFVLEASISNKYGASFNKWLNNKIKQQHLNGKHLGVKF